MIAASPLESMNASSRRSSVTIRARLLQIRTTAQPTAAAPQVGIANPGFWGIPVVNSTGFTISLYAYSPTSSITAITAALISRDGQIVNLNPNAKRTRTVRAGAK